MVRKILSVSMSQALMLIATSPETAEMTAFDSNAQDIHDTRDLARPDGHDIPLSGNEDSPLPGDPNTPPSVAKDLDIPSPNHGTVFAPKHTYPPYAHKSI